MKHVVTGLLLSAVMLFAGAGEAATLYVSPGESIQAAIDVAVDGDVVRLNNGLFNGEGNYNIRFKGKAITVEAVNAGEAVVDARGSMITPRRVFIFDGREGPGSVLRGITITGGCIFGIGGGIYARSASSPTIVDCVIINNGAIGDTGSGGGIACVDNSNPLIDNCTIVANDAEGDYGGGGIYMVGSSPIITRSLIFGNATNGAGAGIYALYSAPIVTECEILANTTEQGNGGGMCNWDSPSVILNNVFALNLADGYGGGLFCRKDAMPVITNNTFTENIAGLRGREVCGNEASLTLTNCIMWSNTADTGADTRIMKVQGTGTIATGNTLTSPAVTDWTTYGIVPGVDVAILTNLTVVIVNAPIDGATGGYIVPIAGVDVGTVQFGITLADAAGNPYNGDCDFWIGSIPEAGADPVAAIVAISYSRIRLDYCLVSQEPNLGGWYIEGGSSMTYRLIDGGELAPTDIFVAPGGDDGSGTWLDGADWHLAADSAAIDAGHPYMDYMREPYYNGGRINVGAYGNTPEAAISALPADPADLDGRIIIESNIERGDPDANPGATVVVDIYAEDFEPVSAAQFVLKFFHEDYITSSAFGWSPTTLLISLHETKVEGTGTIAAGDTLTSPGVADWTTYGIVPGDKAILTGLSESIANFPITDALTGGYIVPIAAVNAGAVQFATPLQNAGGNPYNGDCTFWIGAAGEFGRQTIVFEGGATFPGTIFPVSKKDRRTAGFVWDIVGDVQIAGKVHLFSITYDLPADVELGTYTIFVDEYKSFIGGIAGGEPYDMIPGSFTVSELAGAGPPCPGDANGDGTVNILDMVYVRNNLNRNPLSDPGVQAADVNQDGRVNILDMIFVRTNLGNVCP